MQHLKHEKQNISNTTINNMINPTACQSEADSQPKHNRTQQNKTKQNKTNIKSHPKQLTELDIIKSNAHDWSFGSGLGRFQCRF